MRLRHFLAFIVLLALPTLTQANFDAEVGMPGGGLQIVTNGYFFSNNGYGMNAIPRDSVVGTDRTGVQKSIPVSGIRELELTGGKDPRSAIVRYSDGEVERLTAVNLAFIIGRGRHGEEITIKLFTLAGNLHLKFLNQPRPAG